jgi:hypothetical protein
MAAKEILVKKYVVRLNGEERERLRQQNPRLQYPSRRALSFPDQRFKPMA